MSLIEIIIISVSLSMDAFAVAITLGLSIQKPGLKAIMLPGLFFGFFQGFMPLVGYYSGIHFVKRIQYLDHWIALILLGFIGGNMIKESFSKEGKPTNKNHYTFIGLLILSIATSIDALAVGITFAFLKVNIITAVVFIGTITCSISMSGVKIGNIFGLKFKSKAELLGGMVLVLIGLKIFIEHVFF